MNKQELIKEYEGARFAMVTVSSVLMKLSSCNQLVCLIRTARKYLRGI